MITLSVAVQTDNNKIDVIITRSKSLAGKQLQIGYPTEAPVVRGSREGSKHKPYSNIQQLRRVMIYNEDGTRNIPARPWFSPSTKENEQNVKQKCEDVASKVVSGKISTNTAFEQIGDFEVTFLRDGLRDVKGPALKPETIKRKESSLLLRDTFSAYNSLTWIVKNVGP